MSSKKDNASKPKGHQPNYGNASSQPTIGNHQKSTATHATSRQSMPTTTDPNVHQRSSTSSGRASTLALISGTIRYQPSPCRYHDAVTNLQRGNHVQGYGLSPMKRYLNEGPSEQHAAFIRPDSGNFSLSRGCTCYVPMDEGHHTQR